MGVRGIGNVGRWIILISIRNMKVEGYVCQMGNKCMGMRMLELEYFLGKRGKEKGEISVTSEGVIKWMFFTVCLSSIYIG